MWLTAVRLFQGRLSLLGRVVHLYCQGRDSKENKAGKGAGSVDPLDKTVRLYAQAFAPTPLHAIHDACLAVRKCTHSTLKQNKVINGA